MYSFLKNDKIHKPCFTGFLEKICVNKKGANYELMTKSKFLFNSNVYWKEIREISKQN